MWRKTTDPLFRGDAADAVSVPVPGATSSIVRHILFLDGPGRATPYLSTTERDEVAAFWGARGRVWKTTAPLAEANGVSHIDNKQLLTLLKGNGKGKAKWPNAYEVMQARKYAEQSYEHLLDFANISDENTSEIVMMIFSKA